jgi:hypothetical protein
MTFMNDKISKKVAQLLAERDEALRPVWIRAPKPGETDHYCGLGRGKLYQFEAAGLIKTASLKPPGAVRGVKLFNLKSVLDLVESCAKEPSADKSSTTDAKLG